MFDGLFKEFGDDPKFKSIMSEIAGNMVLNISNDLKFGKINIDDDLVGAAVLVCIQEFSFPFLKSVNFALNSSDADKLGDVNEFIDKLQALYINAENKKKEVTDKPIIF